MTYYVFCLVCSFVRQHAVKAPVTTVAGHHKLHHMQVSLCCIQASHFINYSISIQFGWCWHASVLDSLLPWLRAMQQQYIGSKVPLQQCPLPVRPGATYSKPFSPRSSCFLWASLLSTCGGSAVAARMSFAVLPPGPPASKTTVSCRCSPAILLSRTTNMFLSVFNIRPSRPNRLPRQCNPALACRIRNACRIL
jgi:hypothetical protein